MSILNKITPGKWMHGYNDGSGVVGEFGGGYIIAESDKAVIRGGKDDWDIEKGVTGANMDEAKANAKAIAAVPEMISIIERLANAHIQNDGYKLKDEAIDLLNELNK